MLEKINELREKLENQMLNNVSYETILKTSQQIDELLVAYYKSIGHTIPEKLVLIK